MRNLKRALASILAVAMLSTSVNVGFAAKANFSDVDSKYTTAVTRLAGIDILTGYEDGTFKPEGTITRAEAAAVMVRMLGKEKLASYSAGLSQFSDMTSAHWANGYVNVAASAGLVKGYEDGSFKPDEKVTYAEIVTMMVRAIGAGEAVGSAGTWPNNYLNFALSEGLTDDVAVVPNAPAVRGDVAIMANSTLDTTMWEATGYNTDGTRTYAKATDETKTLFTDKLELTKYEMSTIVSGLAVSSGDYSFTAKSEGATKASATISGTYNGGSSVTVDGTTFTEGAGVYTTAAELAAKINALADVDAVASGTVVTITATDAGTDGNDITVAATEDLTESGAKLTGGKGSTSTYTFADGLQVSVFPGEEVDILTNADDEVVSIQHAKDSNQKVVSFGDITSLSGTKVGVKLLDGTTKTYDYAADVTKSTNGTTFENDADLDLSGKAYLNQNGKVTMLYTYDYSQALVVKEVKVDTDTNKYTIKADTDLNHNSSSLSYDLDDNMVYATTPAGLPISLADIKEGDMVMFSGESTTKPEYIMVFPADVVEGTVDAEDADQVSIDGTDYDYSNNMKGSVIESISVDDSVKAYLDPMGQVVTLEKVTGGTSASGNYGIITDFYQDAVDGKGKKAVKINLFDLSSGIATGVKVFDAENSDKENDSVSGQTLYGYDFYSSSNSVDDPNGVTGGNVTTTAPGNGYYDLLGKVVKYDIDTDKVTIYSVDADDIKADSSTADFDADKDKYVINSANYYADASTVKAYQATELDAQDNTVTVKAVDYSTLKDTTDKAITVVGIDDDKNVSYVYYPLNGTSEQTLDKSNSDNIGIISKVREISSEDVEVTVITKDETKKFYVDKDEKDNIRTTAFNGSSIALDNSDDYAAFKGMLVSYSADADSYVTKDNIDFNHSLTMAKFQELTSRNELTLLDTADVKANKDAYKDMFVVDAEITQKAHDVAINHATLTGDVDLAAAATAQVKAATAVTDKITITVPSTVGVTGNQLKVNLTTAADDNLAVTGTDATKTINIALANTTATKNTAALIQTAIRAIAGGTVGGIDVTGITVVAAGNWDTAAKATGEIAAVSFTGGATVAQGTATLTLTTAPFDGETVVVDGKTYEFDKDSDTATGNIAVAINSDNQVTAANLAAAITTAEAPAAGLVSAAAVTTNVVTVTAKVGVAQAVANAITVFNAPVMTNIAIDDVNSIYTIDEDTLTYLAAHNTDEASTVYYYMVDLDTDDAFDHVNGTDAVMVMIYDSNEF